MKQSPAQPLKVKFKSATERAVLEVSGLMPLLYRRVVFATRVNLPLEGTVRLEADTNAVPPTQSWSRGQMVPAWSKPAYAYAHKLFETPSTDSFFFDRLDPSRFDTVSTETKNFTAVNAEGMVKSLVLSYSLPPQEVTFGQTSSGQVSSQISESSLGKNIYVMEVFRLGLPDAKWLDDLSLLPATAAEVAKAEAEAAAAAVPVREKQPGKVSGKPASSSVSARVKREPSDRSVHSYDSDVDMSDPVDQSGTGRDWFRLKNDKLNVYWWK
jgi:hypothetical protein